MNKEQEKRAEEIIKCLKENNGKTTFEVINSGFINETMINTITVLEFLEELYLVKNMGNKLFRLTIEGSKFKSFNSFSWKIKSITLAWRIIGGIGVLLTIAVSCFYLYDRLIVNDKHEPDTKHTIKSEVSHGNSNSTSQKDSLIVY